MDFNIEDKSTFEYLLDSNSEQKLEHLEPSDGPKIIKIAWILAAVICGLILIAIIIYFATGNETKSS